MKRLIKPISKSVLKEFDDSKELHVNDGDMNFVNKHLFTSPPDAKYKRTPLQMVNWEAMDDRQRGILMANAQRIAKGESYEKVHGISESVLKETNSCKGLESDCDMNFVNKWLFPPRDGWGTTGQLTMVQWGAYDDKQRGILMDKAEKKSNA